MQWRLFPEGTVPECVTREWHRPRERAPHLEQFGPQRNRLLAAANHVLRAREELGIHSVVDLGAGDGGLLSLLPRDIPRWGYDLCPANVAAATYERGVAVRYADFMDVPIEWAELAVCTEVLEHLVDPHAFVRQVAEHCRVIVASSPATETDQQHYEHHLWAFDEEGYRELLEQAGYRVVRHERVDWFQVATAVCA
jgi:2-polyprenyl-3-methyl-5-hydroxy-6-metoxy-1,4-benzoquinol methylase